MINHANAARRARLLADIREFFNSRGYLEVDTPQLAPALIPESSLDVFITAENNPHGVQELYLTPSPEVWMKKLYCRGFGNIYQLAHSFRNGEQNGAQHNREFMMLEWYSMEADYFDSLNLCEQLLLTVDHEQALTQKIERLSVQELFMRHTGIDLLNVADDRDKFAAAATEIGVDCNNLDSWEEIFNYIFVDRLETGFEAGCPLFLYDYPAAVSCLARPKAATPFRERWELYIGALEIANAYSEEHDPRRLAEYFTAEQKKQRNKEKMFKNGAVGKKTEHKVDTNWYNMYNDKQSDCSGVALGVDRLLMALLRLASINDAVYFAARD